MDTENPNFLLHKNLSTALGVLERRLLALRFDASGVRKFPAWAGRSDFTTSVPLAVRWAAHSLRRIEKSA